MQNHYQILGLTTNATQLEIKSSFRKLAKLHHPDKNPGNATAEAMMKKINTAYDVLSSDIKKAKYDTQFNFKPQFSSAKKSTYQYNSAEDSFFQWMQATAAKHSQDLHNKAKAQTTTNNAKTKSTIDEAVEAIQADRAKRKKEKDLLEKQAVKILRGCAAFAVTGIVLVVGYIIYGIYYYFFR